MLHQENEFDEEKSIWDNILSMKNETVKLVREYEEYIESGKEDADKLDYLLTKMDELDAWNFENELQQILTKLKIEGGGGKLNNESRVAIISIINNK